MPQDATCPKCTHTFPVTEARQAFTVTCPRCEGAFTVEFKKPSTPPDAGEPPYQLRVKAGALPGATAPVAPPKKKPSDDDEDAGRKGGSAMIVLLSGGMGLLFVLGGLGLTAWFLFTQIDTTETVSNRSNTGTGTKGNTGTPKGNTGPKGGAPGVPGFNPGPGPDPFNPPPFVPPQPKKEPTFDLIPAGGALPPITPPDLPTDPSQVDLGSRVGQIAVGGGGRHLVMHFPDKGQLGVFDVSTAQVDFGVADGGDVRLAAGLARAVVYVPGANVMRVYDVPGLKKQYEAASPATGLRSIAMGSRTNGPLLGVGTFGDPVLVELRANDLKEIEGARKERSELHWNHLRAAPDGLAFTTFDGFRNNKTTTLTVENRRWKVHKDIGEVPFPGADGNYYGNGVVMDRAARDQRFGGIGTGSNNWYVPAASGTGYFLKVAPATVGTGARAKKTIAVTVHTNRSADAPAPGTTPFIGLPEFDGLADRFGTPSVAYDQHLFLIPEAKLLVTLTAGKDKLLLRKVDLR